MKGVILGSCDKAVSCSLQADDINHPGIIVGNYWPIKPINILERPIEAEPFVAPVEGLLGNMT